MIPNSRHKRWAVYSSIVTALLCVAFPNLSGLLHAVGSSIQATVPADEASTEK